MTGVTQLWFNGYDESAVQQFSSVMEGVYLFLGHVPFEVGELDHGQYPGMDRFLATLHRYTPGTLPSEAALVGWMSADLFTTGLRAVGRDVTRSRLVAALNRLSSFTADGILAPVDWKIGHKPVLAPIDCTAFVVVHGGHFVPVYGTPPSVFSCYPVPRPRARPSPWWSRCPPGSPRSRP